MDIITYRIDDVGPGNFEILRHTSRLGHAGLVDTVAECFTPEDAQLVLAALKAYQK